MNTVKNYTINLTNGLSENVKAEIVTYDQAGNLIFFNTKKTLQTPNNPEGESLELVKCYNSRHYVSYGHTPLQH